LSFEQHPELSVIVPVLNESATIAPFLLSLAKQRQVRLELILSDGGSDDGSIGVAEALRGGFPFPLTVLQGGRGRAGQLNRGAEAAHAPILLFLHIDSDLPDPLALRHALDVLAGAAASGDRVAGHFQLEFHFEGPAPFPYRFYGAKATLDRRGCTHGDQGFLIGAEFFRHVGPYDTSLPLMEDTFLAERIRETGRWLLLPAKIRTSPRRFVSEGLLPRQTLNAMISNLAAIGRCDLIEELKGCYRSQHAAQRLELEPFLRHIRSWVAALPSDERKRFWYATGSFVRSNAWQIPLFFDLVLGGVTAGKRGRLLELHDRCVARLLNNRAGNCAGTLLVWAWFKALTRKL